MAAPNRPAGHRPLHFVLLRAQRMLQVLPLVCRVHDTGVSPLWLPRCKQPGDFCPPREPLVYDCSGLLPEQPKETELTPPLTPGGAAGLLQRCHPHIDQQARAALSQFKLRSQQTAAAHECRPPLILKKLGGILSLILLQVKWRRINIGNTARSAAQSCSASVRKEAFSCE